MFSVKEKREIADKIQKILRETNHPELPKGEIQFNIHIDGAESWSWADIKNNGAVINPDVNSWNEEQQFQEEFEEFQKEFKEDIEFDYHKISMLDCIKNHPDKLKPIKPNHCEHMKMRDWLLCVKSGGFVDYDGFGCYATETHELSIPWHVVKPSDVIKGKVNVSWTHICWYNK